MGIGWKCAVAKLATTSGTKVIGNMIYNSQDMETTTDE